MTIPLMRESDRQVTDALRYLVDLGYVAVLGVENTAVGTRWSLDTGTVIHSFDEWRLWAFISGVQLAQSPPRFVVPSHSAHDARTEVGR